jgi:hypothetical protein
MSKLGGRKRNESAIYDKYMDNPRRNDRRGLLHGKNNMCRARRHQDPTVE